ncbi:MAG: putative Ig domain-containing protein, partial [Acidobacteria bacterium]|nr:putative Ig domain-containing protein [Acidobacteriota bacterium]
SNTGGSSRVGTITAGGQTFTVTQAGCTYSVDPAGTSIPASGASNLRFSVVTAAGCPWTASSGQAWIVLQSGSSGSGPGPVTYSVGPNGSPQSRSGQITVAGVAVFSINQAGFNCPEIAIEPASLNRAVKGLDYSAVFSATGGTSPYVWSQTGTLPPGMTFEGGTLSGVPTETGTFSLTVVATDARGCPGSRSTSLEVVECVPPPAPVFTSSPGGEVTAGSPVTVSWTAALGQDATGHYELQVSENGACANPRTIETRAPFATIPTTSGVSATLCFRVRAVSGQGCSSSFSGPLLSTVRAAPAEFVVVAAAPAQTVEKGAALPSNVEVVIRNIGSATGSLSVSSNGPLFEPSPRGFGSVRPGEDVRVDVVFSPGASAEPGLKTANLVAAWLEGGIPRTLASPVSLTVLEGAPIDSRGSRLQFFPANQFSFRQAGSGNPPPQQVTVVNTGESPVRLASRIGPGGGWLSVGGDFSSVLSPGATREFTVAVDRRKRSSSDGPPPLVTGLIIVNVDGNPEDSAYAQVIDEEPPAPAPAPGRPVLKEGEFSLILGSAVNAPGSGGTAFISEGWIRNQGSSEEAVDLYWTPGGEDGLSGGGVRKNRLSIAGYASYRLSDLVGSLFQTGNVSGQVEIRSTRLAQLSVRATTDSIRSLDDVIARYGTEIPLVVSGSGVGKGPKTRQPQLARQPQVARSGTASVGDAIVLIPGIRDSHAGYRTNLHFAETTGKEATVLARVYDVEGSPVGEKLVYVPAYSKSQVNSTDVELFGTGKRFDGGTVEVLPKIGSGTVAVFATVIDNASQSFATRAGEVFRVNDALRAVSRAPSPRSAEPAFIPAATRSVAANDSFYTTRVTIANIARVAISLTATYLPDKKYQQASIARRITIPPRAEGPRAVVFQDVVTELFEITQDSAGMVKLEGDLAPLTVASETSTPIDPKNPSRGRSLSALNPAPCKPEGDPFGVYSPSATEVVGTEASGSSASIVTLPAIEEGYAFRTNLILAELAGEPLVVKVRLVRPGSGAAIGEKVYPLDRNERLQINRVIRDVLQVDSGAADFQDIQVEIHAVEGKGRVLALVTKIDNNPSSKRADIFTLGGACGGSPLSPDN